ncbi:MAG: hypothetical protein ACRDK9_07775 [Solirubrobacterales bacterium]
MTAASGPRAAADADLFVSAEEAGEALEVAELLVPAIERLIAEQIGR